MVRRNVRFVEIEQGSTEFRNDSHRFTKFRKKVYVFLLLFYDTIKTYVKTKERRTPYARKSSLSSTA